MLEREIKRLTEPGPVSIDLGSGRPVQAMAIWGNESPSTNNRMEMMGLLEGLRALKRPARIQAHVDSTYLMKAFTDRWLDGWRRRGWVNSQKKPVANRDLWEELLVAAKPHRLDFTWVPRPLRGHAQRARRPARCRCGAAPERERSGALRS